jgi:hypothetical protein
VNVQALKRGDTLLLVLAAHPSTPATNKKRGELRWPIKSLEGTPYSLIAEERAPWAKKLTFYIQDELQLICFFYHFDIVTILFLLGWPLLVGAIR